MTELVGGVQIEDPERRVVLRKSVRSVDLVTMYEKEKKTVKRTHISAGGVELGNREADNHSALTSVQAGSKVV